MQAEFVVEVEEEEAAHVVALGDDDGVLVAQCAEVGEGGPEHGVGRDVGAAAGGVEVLQARLDGGDVADDAAFGQVGDDLAERVEGRSLTK